MPRERISMRKIKEVLRLIFDCKASKCQAAKASGISHSTAGDYLARFKAAGLAWPLPQDAGEVFLEEKLYPKILPRQGARAPLDYEYLFREVRRPYVTMTLLWEEYKTQHPDGYQHSQFAQLFKDYAKKLQFSMRQEHKAGEKTFIDFGDGLFLTDPKTGDKIPAKLFVSVWGASCYTYARATPGEDLESWIDVNIKALEYFKCAPKALVPDNLRAGVSKACRYEPELNPTYADFARHYGVAILPARPYRPKDKAKVENGVLIAKRLVIGRLRNRIFTNLSDLNQAIFELIELLNDKPLTALKVSRKDLFESLDKPNALPLPEDTFEFAQWKKARVGINYHVLFEKHSYSVPYTLIHEELEIRATTTAIEIYKKGQRLLSHKRSYKTHGYTTQKEHMPPSHQKYLEWTPERILGWAKKYGSSVEELVNTVLLEREHPEQAYRACLGIIRLGNHYSGERLDRACQRAMAYHNHTYRAVRTILEKNLDQKEEPITRGPASILLHENVRGPEYYGNDAVLHV